MTPERGRPRNLGKRGRPRDLEERPSYFQTRKCFMIHEEPGCQKNEQEKDDVFTLIRKLNTVPGSPKKWTGKRRFYADSETQHSCWVAKKMDKKKTTFLR